jgi:hypothetical protein
VLAREGDGFHGIETLLCLVSLADTLVAERREGRGVTIEVFGDREQLHDGPSAVRGHGNHLPDVSVATRADDLEEQRERQCERAAPAHSAGDLGNRPFFGSARGRRFDGEGIPYSHHQGHGL